MRVRYRLPEWLVPPVILSVLSVGLYLGRIVATGRIHLAFMNWNLILAWLPLLWAWLLQRELKKRRWVSWLPLTLTALWLLFLPNSFYLVTDFIHLSPDDEVSLLYDVVLIMSFALSGLILGCMSIYIVHNELKKRSSRRSRYGLLGLAFLLSGFAIYLGRYLKYNSWDVLANPLGIIVDMYLGVTNPSKHAGMFTTTLLFFVFTSSVYIAFYAVRGHLKPTRVGYNKRK